MQETQTLFSQDLYEDHLSTINNIHFTAREIDVIACILSARKTSKIAYFLSINTRTVETHIRNIMAKIKCNTRESIVDFIEKSDKIHFLRAYYSLLQVEAIFKKSLKDIAKLNREKNLDCFLTSGKEKHPLITHLKSHLNLAGITVSNGDRKKEGSCLIVVLPKDLPEEEIPLFFESIPKSSKKILYLLQERKIDKADPKEFKGFDIIDFSEHENYYFSFFTILRKILLIHRFDQIISEFKDKYSKIKIESTSLEVVSNDESSRKNLFYPIKNKHLLTVAFCIGLLGSGFLAFHWSKRNENHSFRSDLVIPMEFVLLQRPELISEIDEKFKNQGDIQTVALIGPGGAGKTTLARQYARMKESTPVWEINAETKESLRDSFEDLATIFLKTEEEQEKLKKIKSIRDTHTKEKEMILFVREKIKNILEWFLIFDNVEKFADIQKYFPHDPMLWGSGKIILTTRNANIKFHQCVNSTILVNELTPAEKLDLFAKIMTDKNLPEFTESEAQKAKMLLDKVPPFPLDVSMSAYYLKATQISYTEYLDNLNQSTDDEFINTQQKLLNETGDYVKTRYSIITLSIQKIINMHKDFTELLLLISLLDSQNIPRDLLNNYKKKPVIDNFAYHLNKYSLLQTKESSLPERDSSLSFHRSTQAIILAHLKKHLSLERYTAALLSIDEFLEKYIDKVISYQDMSKIKTLVYHCKSFLNHSELLDKPTQALMLGRIGIIQYYRGIDKEAKYFLEKSLAILGDFNNRYLSQSATFLAYLGNTYKDLGDYEKAKNLLERSLATYSKHFSKDHIQSAWVMVYLGNIYRKLGEYEKSKSILEKSISVLKKEDPKNAHLTWALETLGVLYRSIGEHEKARVLLEECLQIFKKINENHVDIEWILENLGIIYGETGDYQKARDTLEESLLAYKKSFNDDYVYVASCLYRLGVAYIRVEEYKKAKTTLEKSLAIYEKEYGKNHIDTARVINGLGKLYLKEKNFDLAEKNLEKALFLFEQSKHPDIYEVLEDLGELYLQKSRQKKIKEAKAPSQFFTVQAINYLRRALEILKIHFPENSIYMKRIQAKLKQIESL